MQRILGITYYAKPCRSKKMDGWIPRSWSDVSKLSSLLNLFKFDSLIVYVPLGLNNKYWNQEFKKNSLTIYWHSLIFYSLVKVPFFFIFVKFYIYTNRAFNTAEKSKILRCHKSNYTDELSTVLSVATIHQATLSVHWKRYAVNVELV